MIIFSEEIDYAIMFLAAIFSIILFIYEIYKKVASFLNKLSQLPNELTTLKGKYTVIYNDVQILKEKIYGIDGQIVICHRIFDKLISD